MNRHVMVISANGGVGIGVTEALLQNGDTVYATVSRPEKIADFKAAYPTCGDVIALDLARGDDIAASLKPLIDSLPKLDAVVVCGAVSPFAPAEFAALDVFRQTMEINCVSHLAIYKASMSALRKTRGQIIFTGSLSGKVSTPMMAAYCASKFALEGLVGSMRQEAGKWGVEVVLLQPGGIQTPMLQKGVNSLNEAEASRGHHEQALYGELYDQMKHRVQSAIDQNLGVQPSALGDVVISALNAKPPDTRYPVGEDAEFLIEMSRTKSDREVDRLVLDIYADMPENKE